MRRGEELRRRLAEVVDLVLQEALSCIKQEQLASVALRSAGFSIESMST